MPGGVRQRGNLFDDLFGEDKEPAAPAPTTPTYTYSRCVTNYKTGMKQCLRSDGVWITKHVSQW